MTSFGNVYPIYNTKKPYNYKTMMKKNFFKLMLLAIMLASAALANAHDFEVDGIYYSINYQGTKATVTYKGNSFSQYSDEYSGSVVIPASVTYNGTTYPVTSIGDYAFYGCSSLTSVYIRNSVTTIGGYAFYNCRGLTSLKVESGNTVYDSRNNCNAIIETASNTLIFGCKTTIIPNSVTSIGDYAFYNCSGLTSLTIPNSVTKIGYSAFCSCSGLASVTCKATTPPSMENVDTFSDYTTPTLYVPTASVDAYQTTKWWKLFTNIVGVDFSTPGDVNGDGEVNISDVNAVINFILSGQATTAGDVNKDGEVNIADINAVIDIILGGN